MKTGSYAEWILAFPVFFIASAFAVDKDTVTLSLIKGRFLETANITSFQQDTSSSDGSPQYVVGKDDRVLISDMRSWPYRHYGFLAIKKGESLGGACTGFLLENKFVLTAAHCFYGYDPTEKKTREVTEAAFFPGIGGYYIQEWVPPVLIKQVHFSTQWKETFRKQHDYAIAELEENVVFKNEPSFQLILGESYQFIQKNKFTIAGYPSDKQGPPLPHIPMFKHGAPSFWEAEGKIVKVISEKDIYTRQDNENLLPDYGQRDPRRAPLDKAGDLLLHEIDAGHGQSGAPIILTMFAKPMLKLFIVGVFTQEARIHQEVINSGVRITEDVKKQLKKWMSDSE